ncbi:MAG: MFS transporter [Deltaproteobacteria bacterium]|nr:MFS transporter [Deltaproteobacteria bacterium]
MKLGSTDEPTYYRREPNFFYGWYIVGVGFLSHVVSAFHFSSTLSVFVKPLTEDLGVSRGLFSLLRTGEILIAGALAPIVGPLVDRYSGRWLIGIGALTLGAGFILLSEVREFWQFMLVRWILVTIGGTLMGYMVVNVAISRWFIRKRGRAIAIATLGQGISKVGIPLLTASLFLWMGWRQTWTVFGLLTLALVVIPAIVFIRRSPEEMGLHPDGAPSPPYSAMAPGRKGKLSAAERQSLTADMPWSRAEALRTQAFWLITVTFGISNVGIAGLNLHVFAYVTDIGHTTMVAATVMTIIAFTQLSSTLFWGFLSERVDLRKATMLKFLIQALGLSLAIVTDRLALTYAGFFLYGIGLGGSQVLQEIIWADYYGRISLGTVRGLGLFITHIFAAAGPPFFGFLFDATKSYFISFTLFTISLIISAVLILFVRPPRK